MEPVTRFFTRNDSVDVAGTRVHRPAKQFEVILDRLFSEQVRADGAFRVELWRAFAGVEWRNWENETVCYSYRLRVTSSRECASYVEWYVSGEAGEVSDWISDALHGAGWSWSDSAHACVYRAAS